MRLALALLVLCAGCRHDFPAGDVRRGDLADGQRALEPRDGPFERDVPADAQPPDRATPRVVTWSEGDACAEGTAVGWGIDCNRPGSGIIVLGSQNPSPGDCLLSGAPVRYVGCASDSISGLVSTGAACSASEQLVGGMCACGSPYVVQSSAPAEGAWSCVCSGYAGSSSAKCVPKSAVPGQVFVSDHTTPADSTNVVAVCAPGTTLVTGGCESVTGLQASVPFWDGTRWSGWRCLASSSQTLTARIVCAQ